MKNYLNLFHNGFSSSRKGLAFNIDKYRSTIDRKVFIPLLVVITGQKCTLRCKDCGNFTPYLPQTHYNINDICDDFQKLASVARVSTLQIQGGEALVYPELVKLLDCVRSSSTSRYITIATNGTRLLSQNQIKAIKSARASVRISNYGISQQRSSQLMLQCKDNGIPHRIYQFAGGSGNWLEMGGRVVEKNSKKETQKVFDSCPFSICFTLEDGIIARCSRATVAHHAQNFISKNTDFIQLRKLKSRQLRDPLFSYVKNPFPMEACKYCRGSIGKSISPAIQLESAPITIPFETTEN